MEREADGKSIYLDLSIDDDKFGFAASIDEALAQAEAELADCHETVESLQTLKPSCDALDYALAAGSGALCGLIDVLFVGVPGSSPLCGKTDQLARACVKRFASLCHPDKKHFDSLEAAIRFLEWKFKVSYDQTGLGDEGSAIPGMTAVNHHFKSLAHNPSLMGLFFSIVDQFTGSAHFVTDGKLEIIKADAGCTLQGDSFPAKLFCGFVNWLGHIVSDMAGSQSSARANRRGMGIPSPLWTWTNDLIVLADKAHISPPEILRHAAELAMRIYEQGYDMRFQAAQAIPVLLNEVIVRFIYAVRRLFAYLHETPREERTFELMWEKCEPFSNPTIKRMLTAAHGTFCLCDVGDALCRGLAGDVDGVVMRLNVVGIGRFAVSLYGEAQRGISYGRARREAECALKRSAVLEDYIEGLKMLAAEYDDARLLTFIEDFKSSSAYKEAFEKSACLAQMRHAPDARILKSKADIDRYFGG